MNLDLFQTGQPGGEEFRRKVGMMYGVAYALKSAQASRGQDFVIGALEGLWWAEGENVDFLNVPKSDWQWKLLIRVPEFVTKKDVAAFAGWGSRPGAAGKSQAIELETLKEGKCVQVLHVGPYSSEDATIAGMRAFAKKNSLTENGVHHEIYLSDPNKTAPEKLRTILRQPVK